MILRRWGGSWNLVIPLAKQDVIQARRLSKAEKIWLKKCRGLK